MRLAVRPRWQGSQAAGEGRQLPYCANCNRMPSACNYIKHRQQADPHRFATKRSRESARALSRLHGQGDAGRRHHSPTTCPTAEQECKSPSQAARAVALRGSPGGAPSAGSPGRASSAGGLTSSSLQHRSAGKRRSAVVSNRMLSAGGERLYRSLPANLTRADLQLSSCNSAPCKSFGIPSGWHAWTYDEAQLETE